MAKILRKKLLEEALRKKSYTDNHKKGLKGELEVINLLESLLPESSTVIWDPIFLTYKPDLLVIDSNLGFLFIEVKNWSLPFIKKFIFNGRIETIAGFQNPLGQTDNYIHELQEYLVSTGKKHVDIYQTVSSIVIYPSISKDDFLNRAEVKGWTHEHTQKYLSRHFFKDDLNQGIYSKMKSSKKYTKRLEQVLTAVELTNLIASLGVNHEAKIPKIENRTLRPIAPKSSAPLVTRYIHKRHNNSFTYALSFLFLLIGMLIAFGIFESKNTTNESAATGMEALDEYSEEREKTEGIPESSSIITAPENLYTVEEEPSPSPSDHETHSVPEQDEEQTKRYPSIKKPIEENIIEKNSEETITPKEVRLKQENIYNEKSKAEILPEQNTSSVEPFTLGSTKEEVKKAMGAPTAISDSLYHNEWSYKSSSIEFDDNDQVIGWHDYDGRLNVSIGNNNGTSFSLGSTKQEVVDAMGTPTAIFSSSYHNEWSYKSSSIEFDDNNQVIGWNDYDGRLNVNMGSANGSSFSLGSSKQQVINAMGTPTAVLNSSYHNEWSYKSSSIEFNENDVVTGWHDYDGRLNIE